MATARMFFVGERHGKLAFEVWADGPELPFPGPAGRSWCSFKLVNEEEATWEWRVPRGWRTHYVEPFTENMPHDAARSLRLPPWAEVRRYPAGGVGTGYDATFILIEPGHTLKDLNNWLNPGGNTNAALDF